MKILGTTIRYDKLVRMQGRPNVFFVYHGKDVIAIAIRITSDKTHKDFFILRPFDDSGSGEHTQKEVFLGIHDIKRNEFFIKKLGSSVKATTDVDLQTDLGDSLHHFFRNLDTFARTEMRQLDFNSFEQREVLTAMYHRRQEVSRTR